MDPRRFLIGTVVTVTFAFALSGCAIFRGADGGVEPTALPTQIGLADRRPQIVHIRRLTGAVR